MFLLSITHELLLSSTSTPGQAPGTPHPKFCSISCDLLLTGSRLPPGTGVLSPPECRPGPPLALLCAATLGTLSPKVPLDLSSSACPTPTPTPHASPTPLLSLAVLSPCSLSSRHTCNLTVP